VNIILSQDSNQPNTNLTNYTATKAEEKLNQSNRNSNIKKKMAFNTEARLGRVVIVQKG